MPYQQDTNRIFATEASEDDQARHQRCCHPAVVLKVIGGKAHLTAKEVSFELRDSPVC